MSVSNFTFGFDENDTATYITEAENGSDPSNYEEDFADKLAAYLRIYYTPLLITLGAIGNILCIYVFFKSKLKFQSTSQYLSALAVSDTIFLMLLIMPWLQALKISDIYYRDGFCQVFSYISYVCCCFSSWIVVAFTVERCLAVSYPLKRNLLCTVARARYVILGLTIAAFAINIPIIRYAEPVRNNTDCNVDSQYVGEATKFNMADMVISFMIPMIIIVVFNFIIIYCVRFKKARSRQDLYQPPLRCPPRRPNAAMMGNKKAQSRMTKMLLVVSTVYVILNFPAYMMRVIGYYSDPNNTSTTWTAMQHVALMSFNTNFGINFLLYCLSGQNFRKALTNTLLCKENRARRGVAVRRATGYYANRCDSLSASYVSTEPTNSAPIVNDNGGFSCFGFGACNNSQGSDVIEMQNVANEAENNG